MLTFPRWTKLLCFGLLQLFSLLNYWKVSPCYFPIHILIFTFIDFKGFVFFFHHHHDSYLKSSSSSSGESNKRGESIIIKFASIDFKFLLNNRRYIANSIQYSATRHPCQLLLVLPYIYTHIPIFWANIKLACIISNFFEAPSAIKSITKFKSLVLDNSDNWLNIIVQTHTLKKPLFA